MNETLFTIQETPITFVNLLTFLGVILITYFLARGLKSGVSKVSFLQKNVSYGMGSLTYYAVLLVGFYIALTTIGIDLTGIAVVVGALSVGIGFGLQAIFNNFVSGIIILFEKKIRPNDLIQLESGSRGYVKEINVRTTVLEMLDGRRVIVPNHEMISKRIIHEPLLRVVFSIGRETPKETVKDVACDLLKTDIRIVKVEEKQIEYEMVLHKEGHDMGHVLWHLETAFSQKGISILKTNL